MRKYIFTIFATLLFALSCKVSYQFNGASIDYSVTKTININDFQNQAQLVYAPLTQVFNERMKDVYTRNTKLNFTSVNPDLEIEGEVTRYDLTPLAVREDALASQTRLTMSVRMRYKNNKNPQEDKEEVFTAYRDFDSSNMLTDVQDELVKQLTEDIVDQIFNSTMSNW
nr:MULTISPECIES: LPS assembly lipoprotein LptE [unclassified Dysgonomonas]